VKNTVVSNQNTYDYVYNYTDHLGNIRLSYMKDPTTGNLKILEENHYYPFGLKHSRYAPLIGRMAGINNDTDKAIQAVSPTDEIAKASLYKYKYNGKEFQDELGLYMYDMDMRQYDPAIARWVVMDPVIHHSMSPYNAFDNNPVFWADPSGMDATTIDFLRDLFKRSNSGDTWTNNNGVFINSRTGEEAPAPEPAYLAISLHGEGNFRPENMKYFRNYVESIQINGGIDELVAALSKSLGLRAFEVHGYKVKITNKRVMFMAIFSHGVQGEIFGDGGRISSSDLSKLQELANVGGFSGIIYLGGCNAGTGMTESFAQHLANITGATVIAMANDGVAPTGNERTAKTMTYGPKHGSKYEGNFYSFQANKPPTLIGANVDVIQLLDAQRNLDPNR
jgi:RHS repeat-associated protein